MLVMGYHKHGLLAVPERDIFYHTAVIGQSGSGKSYFLARLLEEATLRTSARIVVLDPNGDFRRFYAPQAPQFWTTGEFGDKFEKLRKKTQGDSYDDYESFSRAWRQVRFQFVTADNYTRVPIRDGVYQAPIQVHWKFLESEQDFLLNVDPARYPKVYQGIVTCYHHLGRNRNLYPQGYSLEDLEAAAQDFASQRIAMADYPEAQTLSPEDWLAVRLQFRQLRKRYYRLWYRGKLFQKERLPTDLSGYILKGFRDDPWRVCVVGLASADRDHMLFAANTALYRLWKSAVGAWQKAQEILVESAAASAADQPRPTEGSDRQNSPELDEDASQVEALDPQLAFGEAAFMDETVPDEAEDQQITADARVPTIIVIDEAHNFAPEEPGSPLQARVSEKIARVAAEGRKYGLFLFVASQRPKKLRKGLLAECENSAILRIQSELERQNAADALNVPRETIAQVAQFEQPGDALMVGRWAAGTPKGTFAPARTLVGGASIKIKNEES